MGQAPPKHYSGLDPELVGLRAYSHPAVRAYWRWLLEEYKPSSSIALVTPCSNVKPYTRSPTSRKIKGMLRRLGLWDESSNRPKGIEWLYFSDLLALVPYWRAEEYPACCYELPPTMLRDGYRNLLVSIVSRVVARLCERGLRTIVTFLPRMHRELWSAARSSSSLWPMEVQVKYTIFSLRELESTLRRLIA